MTRYALLVPLAFVFMGCGPAAEGEDCKDTEDCDEGLVCVTAEGATEDEDGKCEKDDATTPPAE